LGKSWLFKKHGKGLLFQRKGSKRERNLKDIRVGRDARSLAQHRGPRQTELRGEKTDGVVGVGSKVKPSRGVERAQSDFYPDNRPYRHATNFSKAQRPGHGMWGRRKSKDQAT